MVTYTLFGVFLIKHSGEAPIGGHRPSSNGQRRRPEGLLIGRNAVRISLPEISSMSQVSDRFATG
jgi:hypothetical protein